MMFHYGFELEGFYRDPTSTKITLPPKEYTTDDFPGLVEIRTSGGQRVEPAYYNLLNSLRKQPFDHHTYEHTFTPAEKVKIRARHYEKGGVVIENIYGKSPKALGNRTIASFQINISEYRGMDVFAGEVSNEKGRPRYGLFDFVPIVRELDREFEDEIKGAGRQLGFYSIKDNCRLEYRSLPNRVFETEPAKITTLLARIRKAIYIAEYRET